MKKKASRFIANFFNLEASGGILLMLTAIVAVICANSGVAHLYEKLLHLHPLAWIPGVNELGINLSLHHLINEGLMAIFFFLVGLELKREVMEGELSDRRNIMLPIIGALGGMLLPALIYVSLNHGDPLAIHGWAIPAATDIAFALGVLTLLGSRVPYSIKIFLTSLAIFDDLGAVLIIALFYTKDIAVLPLAAAAGCTAILACLNHIGATKKLPYLVVGFFLWLATLNSGVDAVVAGVVLAMFIPLYSHEKPDISPLKKLEHDLHPTVSYIILPLFAFANSGLHLQGIGAEQILHPVPLGIALGLFFGKQAGVFGLCFLAIKLKIAQLPTGINWKIFYGVSILCGIGFTMSLFIGGLAFHENGTQRVFDERLGIILGSLVSGLVGYTILRLTTHPQTDQE
ncbi:MAG: Na+/H+ antiporter NhaA [Candidatus Electrothrix sp. GW3-4]|uniref:Na+/H+ antiporter NhaA n=1 Tax=Candidatus Electrothrix sp. GW3-4 TaxID=3126740 RepID=UPI0030CC4C8F